MSLLSPKFARMKLVPFLAASVLTGGFAWAPAVARDLTVAVGDDAVVVPSVAALSGALFDPFAATPAGAPVSAASWPGGLDALKSGAPGWDLVLASSATAQMACDQGLAEKLDWAAIGGRDHYASQGAGDCSVGAFAAATVLTWDHDKFPASPMWSDFWDVAKYPGKRGLRKSAVGNLEIALLADGVAAGDVYRDLRTPDGVARAFRKLDQLRPYLVFWSTGAEAVRFLTTGEVLMTSAPTLAVADGSTEQRHGFAMQWNGSLTTIESWIVPNGAENAAAALRLLKFAGDPALQAKLPQLAGVGGLAKGANDGLAPDQQAASPTLPVNLDKALLTDEAFWRENRDKLEQQFSAWLAH